MEKCLIEPDVSSITTESEITILDDSDSETTNNSNLTTNTIVLPITTRARRISSDAMRKRKSRSLEKPNQRALRLSKQRELKKRNLTHQTKEEASMRFLKDSSRKARDRRTLNKVENYRRRQKDISDHRLRRAKEKATKTNEWPTVAPYDLKCQCLENFINNMSKSNVAESTCALCNSRISSRHMNRMPIVNLKNKRYLHPHSDIITTIPGCDYLSIDDESTMEIESRNGDFSDTYPRMYIHLFVTVIVFSDQKCSFLRKPQINRTITRFSVRKMFSYIGKEY